MEIKLVCFDLGGVMVHVNPTWSMAMTSAGIAPTVQASRELCHFPDFDRFQAGQLTETEYFSGLGRYLAVSPSAAARIHRHILREPTNGTLEIVEGLESVGVETGCLSNTNQPHWQELTGPRFPNIQRLGVKGASQEFGFNKPAPEIFRQYEALANLDGSGILFFDDSAANIAGACRCGWNSVLIDPGKDQATQISHALLSFGVAL